MPHPFRRRQLIATAAGLPLCALPALAQQRRFEPEVGDWRTFDLTTRLDVQDPKGSTRLWVPLPDVDADWQRTLTHHWSGNAAQVHTAADPVSGVRMLYAEFGAEVARPWLEVTSRLQTRGRRVSWERRERVAEDPATLRRALAPTELLPLDGIVRDTARQITQGAATDEARVRAIYEWVVANAHREPKVRGCGIGDIKAMLETGDLSGKCADLNALFVGLCRASGVPARDVYGLRLAPSAFGYRELGAGSASLKGAQHCRAEVFLRDHGWVAMDPADVLKVMRQETPDWIKDVRHPVAAPVHAALFGRWEGNWVGYNRGHDVRLPGSAAKGTLPFLMYPNGENASGRFDELAPDGFRYAISAREVTA